MKTWIMLPYDSSPVAKATLRRAAEAVRGSHGRYAGVIVATAGIDPLALSGLVHEVQQIAGPDVPVEPRLLSPGDPIAALHRLAGSLPDAVLAAPLGAKGRAPWYERACVLGGLSHTLLLFYIMPKELKAYEEGARAAPESHPWLVPALRAAAARLRRGRKDCRERVHGI